MCIKSNHLCTLLTGIIFQYSVAFTSNEAWFPQRRFPQPCHDFGYIPEHGSRKPPVNSSFTFFNGSTLRYECDENYVLHPSTSTQICVNGGWVPSPPKCVPDIHCLNPLVVHYGIDWSDVPVPAGKIVYASDVTCYSGYIPDLRVARSTCTANGNWSNDLWCIAQDEPSYCPRPAEFLHGVVICCVDSNPIQNNSNYCCPSNGKIQFVCNEGFQLTSATFEWYCHPSGHWSSPLPTCERITTSSPSVHSDHSTISDGMVKTVIGVTVGILSLLLVVVAFAFCKPKLKEIKRRWRDFREDETGLIVDGRRVALPSYEQATSFGDDRGWSDLYHQQSPPTLNHLASSQDPPAGGTTMPPVSNLVDTCLPSTSFSNNDAPPHSGERSHVDVISIAHQENSSIDDFPSSSRDHITALEFLRESSSPRNDPQKDMIGFENNFTPIINSSTFRPPTPESPSGSLSSTGADTAPLLGLSSGSNNRRVMQMDVAPTFEVCSSVSIDHPHGHAEGPVVGKENLHDELTSSFNNISGTSQPLTTSHPEAETADGHENKTFRADSTAL